MILKILAVLIILFFLYRLFGGKLPSLRSKESLQSDTLVECATCQTFVSTKESLQKRGKHYCSKACEVSA